MIKKYDIYIFSVDQRNVSNNSIFGCSINGNTYTKVHVIPIYLPTF